MDRLLTAPGRGRADADAPPVTGRPAVYTPPHRTPAGSAPRRSSDEGSPRRSSDQRPARRVVTGVLVGALMMFGVATLDTFAGASVPVLGSLAALPAPPPAPDVVEVPPPPAAPGTCLNWSRPDAADTAVVDCAQPHLFEQAGSVTLGDQAVLPDDRQWRQLVNERCTPVVVTYMNGKFDPAGRYRVGALKPSPPRWAQGDRELRCGLQSASRSGALYPLSGRAAESDQSAVYEPGTCLAIDGRTIGDPVDCSGLHALETVGIVDLSAKFPGPFPATADQDAFLLPECGRIANEYAGGAEVISAKKLTVYSDNLTEESWAAGTRKVNCNVAALLPDESGFAPITGPVRGTVVVGETPAPPATRTPEAGVPAPATTAPAATAPAGPPAAPPAAGPSVGAPPPAGGPTTPPAGGAQPPASAPPAGPTTPPAPPTTLPPPVTGGPAPPPPPVVGT